MAPATSLRTPRLGCPGLEPGTNRLKAEYSTIELATPKRYRGIEPLASVWKTEVLPLYEYRDGFTNEFYAGDNLLSSAYEKPSHYQEASQLPPFASLASQVLIDSALFALLGGVGFLRRITSSEWKLVCQGASPFYEQER